jgi:hypothetical protein
MTTVTHRRLSVDSTRPQPPVTSRPAWTDRSRWTLTVPAQTSAEDRADFDQELEQYDHDHPVPDPLPESSRPVEAWPDRHTVESFRRIAEISTQPRHEPFA